MDETCCAYCGRSLILARVGARFCTQKCGTYYRREVGRFPAVMEASARFVRFDRSKRPLMVDGRPASSTDPSTWVGFDAARRSDVGEGVGFVLGDGIGCIDLDHCILDGELEPWAAEVVSENRGTFMEVSRSGDGVHIFGLLPEGRGRKIRDGRNIEVYSTGRYIALTGNRFGGSPRAMKSLVVPE